MADYKSSHTGKRVDKAVSKIPAGGPASTKSALVKITGEESGEFVYLKDNQLVFDGTDIGLDDAITKKIDKIDNVGNKIPTNNASTNNSLIAVNGSNGRYIVLDGNTFSFDTTKDPNIVKINKLPTGNPTSTNGALVKINNNGVGSYLYLNTNDFKIDTNNIQLSDGIKDSIDKADNAIPNKKPDKDQSFIILDKSGNGSYVTLDGKTVVLDKTEIKLNDNLQTKIKKIPAVDSSAPSLIKIDGGNGSYVQLKDKQLVFDGSDISLSSEITDKLNKIDTIDAKTAKIPSGNPSSPSVIVVAKDGTSKYVGSNGNVAVSDSGLNVNIDGETINQNGKQIAVNIDDKTIVSDVNNSNKLKVNTADDSITSTDKGIKVNANYIKGLIPDSPIEAEDLNSFSSPIANTYYEHTGYTSVSYKKGIIYFYDGTVYKPIDGNTGSGGTSGFDDFGLTQGQRKYSVVQKRVNDQTIDSGVEAPDEVCAAYQYGSSSFGGACQSGMTEDEFNTFYYDITTSQPKNGGQGLVDGKPTDFTGRTYDKSRNYAFSVNAGNKALGRDSFVAGNSNKTEALNSSVFGFGNVVTNVQPYSMTVGRYNKDRASLMFSVGDGIDSSNRSNAFEVYDNGAVKAKRSDTKVLDNVATESYVADHFVPSTTMGNAVYITSITGNNTVIPYGYEAALGRNSIALYNSDGTLKVTDAKQDGQAVTLRQLKEKIGNDLNLENGTGTSSVQQKQDGTSGTFDFTNKNPNATALDPTLTGQIPYGGTGAFASSFGGKGAAQGKRSFQAGTTTIAKGNYSAAFGDNSVTLGNDSAAFGYSTVAQGLASFASGNATIAAGENAHTEGFGTKANGYATHAEGNLAIADGNNSHAEGVSTQAKGYASHAEGNLNIASGEHAHAEGYKNTASGNNAHAEGSETKAVGLNSHTEGWLSEANGDFSHVEGYKSSVKTTQYSKPSGGGSGSGAGGDAGDTDPSWTASEHRGEGSHASGILTQSSGYASHSEGLRTVADGHVSHAEGQQTYTTGWASHAEGNQTTAEGGGAHAEGGQTVASGTNSHAEGTKTVAAGDSSHAEGVNTQANGDYSHAAGLGTVANGTGQFVVGRYNNPLGENAIFIVGCGVDGSTRNALVVNNNGGTQVFHTPVNENDVVRLTDLNTKLSKSGGSITGNLAIGGNLVVNGTTSTVEATELKVKDKLIYVAKDNAVALTTPAGLITPKYDGTNSGGLVYDNTGTAYVGDITLDSNGNVDAANSDLQPIATRAATTEFTDKHLVTWDGTNNKLVDGGALSDNIIGTDGITIDKSADSEKIEISGKNFIQMPDDTSLFRRIPYIGEGVRSINFLYVDNASLDQNRIPVYRDPTAATYGYSNYCLYTGTPKSDYAAANKKYVDDAISALTLDAPIIKQDLTATFTPVANTYYEHTGATIAQFTKGIIYLYNGTEYKAIDGSGSGITGEYVLSHSESGSKEGIDKYTCDIVNKDGKLSLDMDMPNMGLHTEISDSVFSITDGIGTISFRNGLQLNGSDSASSFLYNFEIGGFTRITDTTWLEDTVIYQFGKGLNFAETPGGDITEVKPPRESGTLCVEPTTLPTEQSLLSVSSTGVHSWKKQSELVDTKSAQNIEGAKTFTSEPLFNAGASFDAGVIAYDDFEAQKGIYVGNARIVSTFYGDGFISKDWQDDEIVSTKFNFPINNAGTYYFAITPNTAPTEPSVVVNAVDRTPTWKPVSELGGKALKVTIW